MISLFGQADPIRHLGLIGRLGQCKQFRHFRLELDFELLDVSVRQRAVARGVGVNLGAVQTYRAYLEQLHFLGQFQHLQEQAFELLQKAAAEAGDGVVVGVAAFGDVAKRYRVVGGAFEFAAGEYPGGVAVHQDREQCCRVVRLGTAPRVLPRQIGQIKPVDHFHNKPRQMILAQPVLYRRRHQVRRLPVHHHQPRHLLHLSIRCPLFL